MMNAPTNRPQLGDIRTMPIGEIAALPAAVLALLQDESEEAAKAARTLADWLHGAIALRYGDRAATMRRATARTPAPSASRRRGHGRRRPAEAGRLGPGRARHPGGADPRRRRGPGRVRRHRLPGRRAQIRRLAARASAKRFDPARTVHAGKAELPADLRRGGALMAISLASLKRASAPARRAS